MKKGTFTLLLALVFSTVSIAQTKQEKEEALQKGMKAIELMDKGQYEESITLLKESQKLDPKSIHYPYEIAYALYNQKEYKKAAKILKKLLNHKDVSDRQYQLLGNSYDMLEKSDLAMEVYQDGLKKFPNSGKLYLEQGVVEYFRENYNEAIALWEKGVEVDPAYSSNYYWLGKVFSYTDERIWSVMYGEAFMNLERNTKRTIEMSEILYGVFKESINVTSDTTGGVEFSKVMTINAQEEFKMPFQMSYGLTMTMSLAIEILNKEKNLSIGSVNSIRDSFISSWYEGEKDKDYPNVLFDFQKELKEKGFLESYNYWLLMKGNEEEFDQWFNKNEKVFEEFVEWYSKNPLEINEKNYFSRLNY